MPRPPASDTASRRELILDASEHLFATQGFAPTTIKQIGERAGVNAALLYYYFADKDTLYREMLQRLIRQMIASGMSALDPGQPPDKRLDAFIRRQASFVFTHPNFPKLMVRELTDHEAARAEAIISELAATMFRGLCELIREGQRTKLFRADLKPEFAAISTIAQVAYFAIARPAVSILLGHKRGQLPASTVTEFSEHAARFALAALAPRSSTRRRKAS